MTGPGTDGPGTDGPGPAAPPAHWWDALPPAETEITCGDARHTIRWADGGLVLPAHPDAEGELILGALGGAKTACTELAGLWSRHRDDLEVLAFGPRAAADEIGITWNDLAPLRSGELSFGPYGPAVSAQDARRALTASALGYSTAAGQRASRGPRAVLAGMDSKPGRLELLTLLALGPAFRVRLAGTVAAAWSGAERAAARAANRPALTAALTGRFGPAAAAWAGVDPDQVLATLHEGPGWGSIDPPGHAPAGGRPDAGAPADARARADGWLDAVAPADARARVRADGWPDAGWLDGGSGRAGLRARVPLAWLAGVWAAGLAVVEGHLVVAVQAARWPDAQVLALASPGATPVTLQVRATGDAASPGAAAGISQWQVTG